MVEGYNVGFLMSVFNIVIVVCLFMLVFGFFKIAVACIRYRRPSFNPVNLRMIYEVCAENKCGKYKQSQSGKAIEPLVVKEQVSLDVSHPLIK